MTVFDYVVIGIVAISLVLGLWRGVMGEMIALAAWVLAFMAALEFGVQAGTAAFSGIADPALRALAGCVLVFAGVLVAMSVVRIAVRSMVKALGLSLSDRLLGMLFGLARGVLAVLLLVAAGGMTSAPQQPWWKQAMLARPLETVVMAARMWLPDDLAKKIRFT
jgi:membrane protein required for colicin V production